MTKRQLIDEIVTMNPTAQPGFLAGFDEGDLDEYLGHLRLARTPRLSGNWHRYDRYFQDHHTVAMADVVADIPEAHENVDGGDAIDLDLADNDWEYAVAESTESADEGLPSQGDDEDLDAPAEGHRQDDQLALAAPEDDPESWLF